MTQRLTGTLGCPKPGFLSLGWSITAPGVNLKADGHKAEHRDDKEEPP